ASHPLLHSFPSRRSSDLSQKLSAIDAFPKRIDLISVPLKTIPAVYFSINSNSNFARLFCMLTFFCIDAKIIKVNVCKIIYLFLRSEEHTSELQSRENLVC